MIDKPIYPLGFTTHQAMKILITAVILFSIFMVDPASGADKSDGKTKPTREAPPYPGQPRINGALKELGQAQKKASTTGSGQADALVHLKKAENAMEDSGVNKGTYRVSAIRLIGQAIKHLEKGEVDIALKEIEEATEAVHKAGKIGAK